MTTATKQLENFNLSDIAQISTLPDTDHKMQLLAFHDTYGVPFHIPGNKDRKFTHMTNERVGMRVDLIVEEVLELLHDGFNVPATLDYQIGALGASTAEVLAQTDHRDGAQVMDALGDIVYLCYGMALEMGYDLTAVIAEIHASNLTKLGADGNPIMREDGKVLKGPNYVVPNIPAALGWEPEA